MLVTIRPSRQSAGALTYSLPNIHGDVFATVDADGFTSVCLSAVATLRDSLFIHVLFRPTSRQQYP